MGLASLRAGILNSLSKRVYYGWVILAACTVMFFASGPG